MLGGLLCLSVCVHTYTCACACTHTLKKRRPCPLEDTHQDWHQGVLAVPDHRPLSTRGPLAIEASLSSELRSFLPQMPLVPSPHKLGGSSLEGFEKKGVFLCHWIFSFGQVFGDEAAGVRLVGVVGRGILASSRSSGSSEWGCLSSKNWGHSWEELFP